MRRDSIVLGNNYILPGSDVGKTRPNANALVVGISGCGKSNGELPREVRYIFDDFACTAPIQGWANDISLFRSAGLSAIMLLQSEQQLEAIYKDDAPIIRQNCAVYAYFPGGFDDKSCEIVSKRMCLPYDEVLYAPLGKVFIMQSGKKPVHIQRYDTLNSEEYLEYLEANKMKRKSSHAR